MSIDPFNPAAREVLGHYADLYHPERLLPLGNHGGFSGARLWRVETAAGFFCLRAWPPNGPSSERLAWIHGLMQRARDAGLLFIPALVPDERGKTWFQHAGRFWELTAWMPGQADYRRQPNRSRLEAACKALGMLHRAWADLSTGLERCPAVERRLDRAREWSVLLASGWRPSFPAGSLDPLVSVCERAWELLRVWAGWVPQALAPWASRPVPLQPCLCDVWHAHVLFEEDQVAGLIDFGGVKMDHVAVDLARLLGSLVGDKAEERDTGLRAYRSTRSLSWEMEPLVTVLDRTGALIGVMNWLRWLHKDGKHFEDRTGVCRRLAELVERIELWPSPTVAG